MPWATVTKNILTLQQEKILVKIIPIKWNEDYIHWVSYTERLREINFEPI